MTVQLARLSVCPCGFPAISEDLPLGLRYEIAEWVRMPTVWVCGKCGKVQRFMGVFVVRREGTSHKARACGFLPEPLFQPVTETNQPLTTNSQN